MSDTGAFGKVIITWADDNKTNINLENGEGSYALQQKTEKVILTPEDEPELFANLRSIVGHENDESLEVGKATGNKGAVALGWQTLSAAERGLTAGSQNLNYGTRSALFGTKNINTGANTVMGGLLNINTGIHALVGGQGCRNNKGMTATWGLGLINNHFYQALFGRYNEVLNGEYLFTVGNGRDNNNRSNALALTGDGILILGKAPDRDMAATTKKYVDTKYNNVIVLRDGGYCSFKVNGSSNNISEDVVHFAGLGNNCTIKKSYGFTAGQKHRIFAQYANAVGQENTIWSSHSFSAGGYNIIGVGTYNAETGEITITKNAPYSGALGFYLETSNRAEIAVGEYNLTKDDLLHSVGNGTSENRKNALEVYKNGRIARDDSYEIVEDNDLVDKKFVDDKIIVNSTDLSEGALLTTGTLYVVYEE